MKDQRRFVLTPVELADVVGCYFIRERKLEGRYDVDLQIHDWQGSIVQFVVLLERVDDLPKVGDLPAENEQSAKKEPA